eukprot:COSAG02_NODE_50483_length_320_cov_0.705882_1_plen_53_part_10
MAKRGRRLLLIMPSLCTKRDLRRCQRTQLGRRSLLGWGPEAGMAWAAAMSSPT